ncbi:hypothetical protein F383_16152 [Gossypium arboreum]|uniref:Uncharacterized protein n=1 Tax=Gossypium arboreum TaxID=29729 RepID=A0A0B0PR14_GOSAR|nr:hypothetical protein F383_01021 [Gossypium arboreum]KHG28918.1 hypothetical protein F383_16152 [Gossypium arboreum]
MRLNSMVHVVACT